MNGEITEFPLPTALAFGIPGAIAAGPDGNVWFGEPRVGQIGRITPAGVITEFAVPSGGQAYGITAGPDDNLWFTEAFPVRGIGRVIGLCHQGCPIARTSVIPSESRSSEPIPVDARSP